MKDRAIAWLLAVALAAGAVLAVVPVRHVPVQGQEAVIDYKNITADRDKVAACYSLIKQMLEEQNRQAALAQELGGAYHDKLRTYMTTEFKPRLKLLLYERNRLIAQIIGYSYSAREWLELSRNETLIQQAYDELLGEKTELASEITVATSDLLASLKLISLAQMEPTKGIDPLEDFTTYDEADPGVDITVAATNVSWLDLGCNTVSYVADSKGAAHFSGDFTHLFTNTVRAGSTGSWVACWCLANQEDSWDAIRDDPDDMLTLSLYDSAGQFKYTLYECNGGSLTSDATGNINNKVQCWITMERDEAVGAFGTLYAYIYSDATRETLWDTLAVTLTEKQDFQYVYAVQAHGDVAETQEGWTSSLDLQEVNYPSVDTLATDDIEDTTATLNANVTLINDTSIDDRGFGWGTSSQNPANGTAPSAAGYDSYWTEAGSFGVGLFDHGITGLATATTHYARGAANNSDANWGWGDEVSWLTKPAAPTNVAATDGVHTDKVVVTWTKSSGTVTGYKIYRDGGLIDTVGDVATYDDTGADAPTITPGAAAATDGVYENYTRCVVTGESGNDGTSHTYKVRAYNGSGDSDDSSTDTGYRGKTTLNYNWYESFGDAASNYTAVGNYSEPFDDYTPAYYPSGHYYLCAFNMTDATAANSTADRGYAQSSNVTAIYLYPNWQAKLVGLNASVWAVAWHGATVAANASVSWNVTGNGTIEWSETTTGGDGRADALISCNVTENVTVCGISGNCSDCGIIAFHTETGGGTDLPLWYFAIIGVALVGAFYTKDIMLYIMAVVACGGGVWFAQNSALESEIALVLTATFVILGAVMVFGILRHGHFSFVRGGNSE